jgi:hypothetical protein
MTDDTSREEQAADSIETARSDHSGIRRTKKDVVYTYRYSLGKYLRRYHLSTN